MPILLDNEQKGDNTPVSNKEKIFFIQNTLS